MRHAIDQVLRLRARRRAVSGVRTHIACANRTRLVEQHIASIHLCPIAQVEIDPSIDVVCVLRKTAAGVRRACVVRAVGEAIDPEAAARGLRAMLEA